MKKMEKTEKLVVVGLIKGRHSLPVSEYIFQEALENVLDFVQIDRVIENFLVSRVGVHSAYGVGVNQASYGDCEVFTGCRELVVYVTGLTAVTAALVAACARNGVALTLMHFDASTGEYVPQELF